MYRHSNPYLEQPHSTASSLAIVRKRDGEIPRFLFRGFNKHSGGNEELNTAISIQSRIHTSPGMPAYSPRGRGWTGAAMTALFGMTYKFYPWDHIEIHRLPYQRLREDICDHIRFEKRQGSSPFSSWTADLVTAMRFATAGPAPQIGVFDIRKRNDYNAIMHVSALWEAGLSDYDFPEEYLVYGPVHGACYTCPTPRWPMISCDLWTMLSINTTVASIRKARSRVAHHRFYRVGDAWFERFWGVCTDSAVHLTMIAAEWGRTKTQADTELQDELWPCPPIRTSTEEIQEVVFELWDVIEKAANDPNLMLPLVNPRTVIISKQMRLMIILLMRIEQEIIVLRPKTAN